MENPKGCLRFIFAWPSIARNHNYARNSIVRVRGDKNVCDGGGRAGATGGRSLTAYLVSRPAPGTARTSSTACLTSSSDALAHAAAAAASNAWPGIGGSVAWGALACPTGSRALRRACSAS
eukprot:366479-Chlamydomonas_euryale.AAC.3